jgi:CRISPR-associated protein Cmr3
VSRAWLSYRLTPEDVLFFRDGKPASMGEDHYLRSIFPPYPSTLYGMVRTQLLLEAGQDLSHVDSGWWKTLPDTLRAEVGEWNAHGTLRLRGPWIVRRKSEDSPEEILLPAPHDLLLFVDPAEKPDAPRNVREVFRLSPDPRGKGDRDWSHNFAPMSPNVEFAGNEPESAEGWFLTMDGVARWMAGQTPLPDQFVDPITLWITETRTGLGLQEKRRASADGMLYTFGFIRLRRLVSIGFEITGAALEKDRHVRLGGESRMAFLESGPSLTEALASQPDTDGDGVCALITPGIFSKGSEPPAAVAAAVVSGMVRIGGWDLARPGPKPLKRAAPAGSVYYIDKKSHRQLDSLSEQDNEGFGLMLCGKRPRR